MEQVVDQEAVQFQSTLPVRGATPRRQPPPRGAKFQSTLPVRGATLSWCISSVLDEMISIHAPREGSDVPLSDSQEINILISIHAPREGSDVLTPAGWAEPSSDFNPRSP